MSRKLISRRAALIGGAGVSALLLSGCDAITRAPTTRRILKLGETLSMSAQRLLLSEQTLAREFSAEHLSPTFRTNGATDPQSPEYLALKENNFAAYRLIVDGLVQQPLSLSLEDIKRANMRAQITRHDCVEGWSAIGKWTGLPLFHVLQSAQLLPEARFVVFHCFDLWPVRGAQVPYYESIDLFDAFHPQTMLAYALNDAPLSIGHGAPLRLRVERQLGYKHAKYIKRISLTDRLDNLYGGAGGFWEDRAGYEWYGGI